MPNAYTLHRQRRKERKPKISVTSKRVRIHSGGRRIRIVANKPIEEATSTGTKPIELQKEVELTEKKKPKRSKSKTDDNE